MLSTLGDVLILYMFILSIAIIILILDIVRIILRKKRRKGY